MDRKKGRTRWRKPYRRLLAFVMALIVSLSIMPQTTFAYIGAIRGNAKGDKLRTGNFTSQKDRRGYVYLENDYIHFDLCVTPRTGASLLQNMQYLTEVGKIAHTIPTSVMKDMKTDDLDSFGVQEIKHQISTPADLTLDEKYQGMNKVSFATLAETDSLEWRDVPTLAVKSYGRAKDYEGSLIEDGIYVTFLVQENREMLNPEYKRYDYDGRYKITRKVTYDLTVFFELVQLDSGDVDANAFPEYVKMEENPEEGYQNWGVHAVSEITYNEDTDQWDLMGEGKDWHRMNITFRDFPKTGHPGTDMMIPTVYANMMDTRGKNMFHKNISSGLDRSKKNTVAEVYCNDYGFAAPFVAASNRYNYWENLTAGSEEIKGIEGHIMDPDDEGYGKFVSYGDYKLEITGHEGYFSDKVNACHGHQLWGYRVLMSKEDIAKMSVEPDVIKPVKVQISESAQRLYVVKNDKGACSVVETRPASYVASYYGVYDKVGELYRFYDGVLSLSPTINMRWTPEYAKGEELPGVTMTSSGSLQFDATKISLDTPTFVFYEPGEEATKTSVRFLGYDVPGEVEGESGRKEKVPYEGIAFWIDAEKNDAIFNIDLPGNGVDVSRANIAKDGNIVFGGELNIHLFVAGLQMQELSYGGSGEDFGVNGINAKGYIDTQKFSVVGFTGGAGRVEGEVNTFPGREKYAFSFELEVEDLFKTGAELELRRLSNGQLCPNNLFAKFRIEGDKGIDITAEAPVVTLQGLGIGAYNIADTVEQYSGGNVKAIPPVLLRAHAAGKVVKALDGELDVYVGPSKFRVEANDLSIKDYKILEQLGAEFYVNDAAFTYGGDQYKGYTVGGGANLSAKILPEGTSDKVSYMKWLVAAFEDFITLNVSGDVHATVAEAYAYRPGYIKPQRKIYGCTSVSALIATKVDGESLFGYEVGTDVATRFSLESVTWDDGTPQAFTTWMNNLTLNGGFAADAYAGDMFAEVKYIIRDGAKAAVGVNGNRTYVNEILKAQGAEIAEEELSYEMGMNQQGEVTCFELEDGLQIVAVVATNTEDLDITSQGASNTTEESLNAERALETGDAWKDTVSVDPDDVDADQNVILVLRPTEKATVDDVKEMVQSVSVNDVPGWERVTTKELSVSENGIISIDDKAKLTVWAGKNISDPDTESAECIEDLENVVYVSVKKDQLPVDDGEYVFGVSADRNFTVEAMKTNPVTRVSGALNAEGKLQPTIQNRQADKDYTIVTYYNYKDEEGNTSINLIDSQTVAAGEEPVAVDLPRTGIHVPSGSYTVSMQLFGGTGASVGEDNEDRIESTLTLPINTATTFGSGDDKQEILIQYVNDNDAKKPASPDYVELESSDTGNGVMNAYWIPVSDEEGIDGYRIKLYQKDDKGNYVDTEKGYTFTEEQLQDWENIDGLEKTEVLNPHSGHMEVAYKVEMAVTAFATAADETIDSLSAEGGLETDKEYKVGICAYKRAEDNIGSVSENTVADSMINRQIYGDEKMSNSEKLMTPDPFDFEITASEGEVTKDGENGVYKYRSDAASGRALIIRDVKTASGVYLNGDDEENNGSISISYIDPETGREEILPMSANNPFYENWDATDLGKTREYWFAVPDFDGLTQLTVRATHYRNAADAMLQAGDETVKYIALENDNIAPVVGVDATEVTTKTDGTFTITGMANSGAEIYIDRQMAGVAGDDGKFKVTGIRKTGDSEYLNICAKDEFDNESEDVVVKVNIKTEEKTEPAKQDPKPTEQKQDPDPGKTEPSQAAVGATLEDPASKAEYVVTSKPGETPAVEYKASKDAKAKKVTIPATITKDGVTYQVTAISDSAFKNNKSLQTVKIEEGVTSIGSNAFAGCARLKSVTVPGSVTKIGSNAFKNCKSLTTIKLGKNVTEIGNGAFAGCKKLKNIKIGAKVKKLGKQLFKGDSNLKTITIQTKLLTAAGIKKGAFKGLGKKVTIKVPKAKKKLYTTIFRKKGLPKAVRIK